METPRESATRDSVQEAVSNLKQAGNNIRQAARTAGADIQHTAQEKYTRGRESAESAALRAEERIKERPLTAIGVAFAAGWLVSRLTRH